MLQRGAEPQPQRLPESRVQGALAGLAFQRCLTTCSAWPGRAGLPWPAEGLVLVGAGACSPHPEKRAKGGEDAHFVRMSASGGALGVADGVGGWKEYGVDAGLYSRRLLQNTADAYLMSDLLQRARCLAASLLPSPLQPVSCCSLRMQAGNAADAHCHSLPPSEAGTFLHPLTALVQAHESTRVPGAATAVVVALDGVR